LFGFRGEAIGFINDFCNLLNTNVATFWVQTYNSLKKFAKNVAKFLILPQHIIFKKLLATN